MTSRRATSLLLILLLAALVASLAVYLSRDDGVSLVVGEPEIVGAAQLSEFAANAEHPIYWLGERDGAEYELTETSAGRSYIRYLEDGAEARDPRAEFLTVGTYPSKDGVAALRRAANGRKGAELGRTDDGAVLLIDPGSPNNAHLAYPGANVQIEVYSPEAGEALRLASGGEVQPVP